MSCLWLGADRLWANRHTGRSVAHPAAQTYPGTTGGVAAGRGLAYEDSHNAANAPGAADGDSDPPTNPHGCAATPPTDRYADTAFAHSPTSAANFTAHTHTHTHTPASDPDATSAADGNACPALAHCYPPTADCAPSITYRATSAARCPVWDHRLPRLRPGASDLRYSPVQRGWLQELGGVQRGKPARFR
jgi:hypothetical protein